MDRPTQGHKFLSRQYVQPQWVFDSANFRVLAKAELYGVGQVPPPHLSPFVQSDEEGYVPDYLQTMLKLQVCSMKLQRILTSHAAVTSCAGRCLCLQYTALSATNTVQTGNCFQQRDSSAELVLCGGYGTFAGCVTCCAWTTAWLL